MNKNISVTKLRFFAKVINKYIKPYHIKYSTLRTKQNILKDLKIFYNFRRIRHFYVFHPKAAI